MGLFSRDADRSTYERPPVFKPEGGVCKRCGLPRLVFFDDGTGECKNCKRTFRWDDGEPGPHSAQQQYGHYDQYTPEHANPYGYSPPYPAEQSYVDERVKVPTEGQCAECGNTKLIFHKNGSGECKKCGRVFDWLGKRNNNQEYAEQYYDQGFYQTSEDMIYALGTGTRPEFIFAELVRQGKSTREANRIVNEALDEYERRQQSHKAYLENAMGDMEAGSGAGFRRSGYQYESSSSEPRRHAPQQVEHGADYKSSYDETYVDDEDEDEDEQEPGVYIELEEDDEELKAEDSEDAKDAEDASSGLYIELDEDAEAEEFGIGFDKKMAAEDDVKDVKLPSGYTVTLPKNSGAKKKKVGKKKQLDLWEME